MKILAVNSGSSSLKWKLFNMPSEEVIADGMFDRIGINGTTSTVNYHDHQQTQPSNAKNHSDAVDDLLKQLINLHIINDYNDIAGVGHRIVAGGEFFKDSAIIDQANLNKIDELAEYAPLHNPPEANGIRAFMHELPHALEVGVFDTSFHTTLPKENYLYSLPYEYYENYGARKYGAHGTSHNYISSRAAEILHKPLKELKMITLHLGNGASLDAIKDGKSYDTSMGFTPLVGVTMGTRSGDVDTSLVLYLMEKMNLSTQEMLTILNHQSGVLGISGISSDMRDILAKAPTDERAQLALDIYVNRIVRYVGAYTAEMGSVDTLVFAGGVGENSAPIRKMIIDKLGFINAKLDDDKNNIHGQEQIISAADSAVTIMVVPTNEELMIAREVQRLSK
ncbi:MAG: acetate kinase [Candidatus Paralactobacillus gallistercoris]|uniref:Acetate kinase n=1 Tax=Candidatus Paralactobacillus gallistercoris TaxID=2838724 RepID=A0A948X3A4_9LACO|nr:acetate kinase [Candidatus Paralactobacillus gallistercoris]